MITRVIVVVVGGLGLGASPDAALYGDAESNTLSHVAEKAGGLALPTMEGLGLGCVGDFPGLRHVGQPDGCFGKMQSITKGKDSTAAHWEMAGIVLNQPFPTYPNGFPQEVLEPFQHAIGRKVLGNRLASEMQIIQEHGEEHVRSGAPIVFTGGDSVFEIAAHERVVSVSDLYEMCRTARKILVPPHQVARVVACPFTGEPGAFTRTGGRKEFSVDPPGQTLLDVVNRAGHLVIGIGKVESVFNKRGLTRSIHTRNNADGMAETIQVLKTVPRGLILVNLNDLDTLFEHHNDPVGYGKALEECDARLAALLRVLRPTDLLCVTSDHGNDPTMASAYHSREYVPVLVYGSRVARGVNLGVRQSLADVGQTVAETLGAERLAYGESFLDVLVTREARGSSHVL